MTCNNCNGSGVVAHDPEYDIFGMTAAVLIDINNICLACDGEGEVEDEEPPQGMPSVCEVHPW